MGQTTDQTWVCKAFGYGGLYAMDDAGRLESYLKKGKPYLELMDMQDIVFHDNDLEDDPNQTLFPKFIDILEPRSLFTKHQFDATMEDDDEPIVIDGVPCFGDPILPVTDANKNTLPT